MTKFVHTVFLSACIVILLPLTGCAPIVHVREPFAVKPDRVLQIPDADGPKGINICTFDPSGRTLAIGGEPPGRNQPARLEIYDVKAGTRVQRFMGGTSGIWDVAFSPDGAFLAACDSRRDRTPQYIRLWDVRTGKMVMSFRNNTNGRDVSLDRVAFSPDGKYLASIDNEYQTVLYDLQSKARFVVAPSQGVGILGSTLRFYFTADGKYLCTGSVQWPILEGFPNPKMGKPYQCPADILLPGGSTAIAVNASRTPADLTEWFMIRRRANIDRVAFPSGKLLTRWQLDYLPEFSFNGIAATSDGHIIATGGPNGILALEVLNPKAPVWRGLLPLDAYVACVSLSPDGSCLAVGGSQLYLWDHFSEAFSKESEHAIEKR